MKNQVYNLLIILFSVLFFSSCTVSKNKNVLIDSKSVAMDSLRSQRNEEQGDIMNTLSELECPIHSNCKEIYNCYKDIFKFKDCIYNDKINALLKCSVILAQDGNIEVERNLVSYFDSVYEFLKPSIENNGVSNDVFGYLLKQLRSPEAFEVAMKYARHGQWSDSEGNLYNNNGISFLIEVIGPMIKSINGNSFYDNFNPKIFLIDWGYIDYSRKEDSNKIHHRMWKEIDTAWKAGKIVLKKYGED